MTLSKPILTASFAMSILASGCATSLDKNPRMLEDSASFATGLKVGNFTISGMRKKGPRLDYTVTSKSGTEFRCYAVTSRLVGSTDSMCTKMSDEGGEPAICNPLLKASGRC